MLLLRKALFLVLFGIFAIVLCPSIGTYIQEAVHEPARSLSSSSAQSMQKIQKTATTSFSHGKISNFFARLRPSVKRDRFQHVKYIPEKTTIEEIYTPDRVREMEAKYKGSLEPAENLVNSPYRHARPQDFTRYEEQNQELAQWTIKEALNQRVKALFHRADNNAAPIKVMEAVQSISSFGDEKSSSQKKKEEQKNIVNPTNNFKKSKKMSLAEAHALPPEPVDEEIPTKLKTKMNIIHARGQVRLTNPIVNTSVNIDIKNKVVANELSVSDRVSIDMEKEFKELSLNSNVKYGVERKVVHVNLSKKITDEISCNLSTERFTGNQRDASGSKGREAVNMMYSVSF